MKRYNAAARNLLKLSGKFVRWFFFFVVLIVLVDLFLRVFFYIKDKRDIQRQYLGAQAKNYYYAYPQRPQWLEGYLQEDEKVARLNYFPFFEWRRGEFLGNYVTLSSEGIRKTWNPDFRNSSTPREIYCLGGSLLWSPYNRNEYTIPSQLSKRISMSHAGYRVTNFAEVSYTLTQEIVYLLLRLKQGQRPYLVIFLDGMNDVFAAYDSGEVGTIVNLNSLRHKFMRKELTDTQMFWRGLGALIEDYSGIRRVVKLIRTSFFHHEKKRAVRVEDREDIRRMAEAIALDYKKNISLAENLGKIFGFKCMFFLQPVLQVTKARTKEEMSYNAMDNKALIALYQDAYAKIKEYNALNKNFFDISDIFDHKDKTVYIDTCHISEDGSKMIADKMYECIKDSLLD